VGWKRYSCEREKRSHHPYLYVYIKIGKIVHSDVCLLLMRFSPERVKRIMQQSSTEHVAANQAQPHEQHAEQQLGPFLCWAVVFADIGTSIYYVPGILYGTVGKLAGFFVF